MTYQTAIDGSAPCIAELYRFIYSDGTEEYYTTHDRQVTYGGNDYTPVALKRDTIKKLPGGRGKAISLAFPLDSDYVDIDKVLNQNQYDNMEIYIYRVDVSDTSNDQTLYHGWVEPVSFEEDIVNIQLQTIMKKFNTKIPKLMYSWMCAHRFGDSKCGATIDSYKLDCTSDSGSTDTVIKDTSKLTQADNYWRRGYIEITEGDANGEKRTIVSSDQSAKTVTVNRPLSVSLGSGIDFSVWPHCELKESKCFTDNFLGCKYIKRRIYVNG